MLPEAQTAELANGVKLSVFPRPNSRAVVVHLVLRAELETSEDQRLARWAMAAALHGADAGGRHGDVLGEPVVEATSRAVHVSWSLPPPRAEQALDWLAQSLQEPQLNQFETSSWQLQHQEQQRANGDAAFLARQLGSTAASATTAPKKPQLWECQRWLRRFLHPSRVHLLWVGALSEERALAWTTEKLAGWTAPPTADRPPVRTSVGTDGATEVVRLGDAVGSAWAYLRLSFPGPHRRETRVEQEWAHLEWGSRALAGPQRLGKLARDHRATGLDVTVDATSGRWWIHVDVAAPAEEAFRLARRVASAVPHWSNEGFSEEELALAAHQLRAGFRRTLQDPRDLSRQAAWLVEQGFDPEALERELSTTSPAPPSVRATWTLPADDAAASTAQATAPAERASVSVVGDAKGLERAFSTWRGVQVFDPKRDLRLVRRLAHDPEASPEVSASSEESSDGSL